MNRLLERLKLEFKIPILYFIIGISWILLSDLLIDNIANKELLAKLQLTKGFFYVFITTLLLYFLLRSFLKKNIRAENIIQQRNEILEAQNFELKNLKQFAEESELQFRLLVDNAPEAIFIQIDWKFAYVNKAAVKLYGALNEQQLLGSKIIDRIHPKFIDLVTKRIIQLNDLKLSVENAEYKQLKLDNSIIDVAVSAVPFKYQNKNGALVFVRDVTERKQIEEKLNKSFDLLNNLARQVPGVIYQYRLYPDGRSAFPYSSPGMYNIYEVTSEEVREDASPVFTRIHPDDLKSIVDSITESAKNQTEYHSEFRVILPKQGERWRLCNANPMLLEDGSTLWHGIIMDITDRKQAEELYKQKNEEINTFFDCAIDLLCIADIDGIFLRLNKEWENVLNYSLEELIGKKYIDFVHPDDIESSVNATNQLANQIEIYNFTNRFRCKDGSYKWIEWRSYPKGKFIYAAARDITEKVQQKQDLIAAKEKAEENEKVKTIVLNRLNEAQAIAKIGNWDWNLITGEVWWSDELYRIFELDPATYIPSLERNAKFVHPEDTEGYHNAAALSVKTGNFLDYNLRIITPEGKIKYCNSTGKVTFDNNIPVRFAGTFSDISIQTQINNELILAKEKAQESDRLKTAFLQNMSHEIRTPMNAIMGFSELLIFNFNNKSKLENFVNIIIQRCNDLLVIIDSILDISKIESGLLTISNESCNLKSLFSELRIFFTEQQNKMGKQQIRFIFKLNDDTDKLKFLTDTVKLKQILINLIGNALKFTDNGTIECGCKFYNSETLMFYVSDTGIGIPLEKQKVIFDRFVQINPSPSRLYGGTGLGLSIVKGLVDLLGGSIWLESEPDKGSVFYFTVPFKSLTSQKAETTTINEIYFDDILQNKTLLVVEDDASNSAYIQEILYNTKLNVIYTPLGNEAIEIAKAKNIDLILMDINLPDITGYEAINQILEFKPKLKIIAQTAYAMLDDQQKIINSGCIDYISKPLKSKLLLEMIHKHLIG